MKEKHEIRLWAVLFWMIVWQFVSVWLDSDILLVSPVKVVRRLGQLMLTVPFWKAVCFTLLRIASGFLLAVAVGVVLAAAASRFARVQELLAPVMLAVKSVPVASFIILALIWFSSRNLSILISFLIVLPVIYTNVLSGIRSVDRQLLEMAQVFRIPGVCVVRYIYLPQIMPFLFSVQCGARNELEGWRCRRSDRDPEGFGWRASAAGKSVSGHARLVCVDTGDRDGQSML